MSVSSPAQVFTAPRDSGSDQFNSRLSEYFYKRNERVLVPVKLLGQVSKPGLYHVPPNTSLTTLLSVSGGTGPQADLKRIQVTYAEKRKTDELDLKDLIRSGKDPVFQQGDVIFVPEKEYMFDQTVVNTAGVLTSIASIVLTIVVINRN